MLSRKDLINKLPPEMVQHIFAYLPRLAERRRLSLVCRRWNELAFDYNYLGRMQLKISVCNKNSTMKLRQISRNYRNVRSFFSFDLDEEDTEKILLWFESFEKHSSSVEELVCCYASQCFLALKLVSKCPGVKKLQLHLNSNITADKLPVLGNLKELVIPSYVSTFNLIRLAPNLRRLKGPSSLDLPTIFQHLPLEYLQLSTSIPRSDPLEKCTEPTKLTVVDLPNGLGDQHSFEQLCKHSPLLTKLRINVTAITSLRCLASLAHLKVLSFHLFDKRLVLNNEVCLPSVETVEFNDWVELPFDIALHSIFPKVHSLKLERRNHTNRLRGKINRSFPHLRTLEISGCKSAVLFDLVEGLPDLRELKLHSTRLSASHLPPMRLQQLTLIYGALKATGGMVRKFPNLQFLNLVRGAECTNADKLPASCTVRRYLRNGSNDIFDVI